MSDPVIYERAARDPRPSGASETQRLDGSTPWQKVLEWNAPWAKWFVGGKLNITDNCVDRHAHSARRNKAAIIWEGEPGDSRVLTYGMLDREVNRFANVLALARRRKGRPRRDLHGHGAGAGHRHAGLRQNRRAAQHRVRRLFLRSLRERINDARPKSSSPPMARIAAAPSCRSSPPWMKPCSGTPSVEKVVVLRRVGDAAQDRMESGRDHWWHDLIAGASDQCAAEPMDSEDMLFVLYTSGTTGKPKGIVHTTGGYLVGAATTHQYIFDIKENDVYWCTADIGWVTGHSYVVYGPLATARPSSCTKARRIVRIATASGRSSKIRRQHFLHRSDRDPHLHALGHGTSRASTRLRACDCSARWANPSTRRPGSGITKTSVASDARSSTPGGRPKPA